MAVWCYGWRQFEANFSSCICHYMVTDRGNFSRILVVKDTEIRTCDQSPRVKKGFCGWSCGCDVRCSDPEVLFQLVKHRAVIPERYFVLVCHFDGQGHKNSISTNHYPSFNVFFPSFSFNGTESSHMISFEFQKQLDQTQTETQHKVSSRPRKLKRMKNIMMWNSTTTVLTAYIYENYITETQLQWDSMLGFPVLANALSAGRNQQ